MRTRDWRRAQRERVLNKWKRLGWTWMRKPGDVAAWARRQLGRGSLSIQGCACCSNLRQTNGPNFNERRRHQAAAA
jgi:hypothetical protein